MAGLKSLNIKNCDKPFVVNKLDSAYWKSFEVPTVVKEFGAINYIDFSPVKPHYIAVTCSAWVQVYNPITKLVVKKLPKFEKRAYGGTYRQDGRLLAAGDEDGLIKLFDVSSEKVLKVFRGHEAAVHRTFFTSDLLHIASFSDDKTVKLWDIETEKTTRTFKEHSHYIRAGSVNPTFSNMIISGGCDNIIKMYDTRMEFAAFQANHGYPVESLLFLPNGGIFISAGGAEIKIWNIAGKLLAKLLPSRKTITCLKLGNNGKQLLSGDLDGYVKIFDIATLKIVHTFCFPNSILSLGISATDQTLAVGMVDGLISIQNMEKIETNITEKKLSLPQIVPTDEAKNDYWLRNCEYSKALDEVLLPTVVNRNPGKTVSVMEELMHREVLALALAGRTTYSIATIINFIIKHLGEHRFMRVLTDVGQTLLDVYDVKSPEMNRELVRMLSDLAKKLPMEVFLKQKLSEVKLL